MVSTLYLVCLVPGSRLMGLGQKEKQLHAQAAAGLLCPALELLAMPEGKRNVVSLAEDDGSLW